MSETTTPVFIIGSGRSGTRMIYRLLSGIPHVEAYHEFECTHIQPIAAKYFMKLINKNEAKKEIMKLHGSSIYYSKAMYWVDSSNKLSWLVDPLHELFPNAKFVHLVRNGKKVVSSFIRKLAPEVYDEESVEIMSEWLNNRNIKPEPPPEKKYWWNIPQKGQLYYKEFPKFNQFQRICYHWMQVITTIDKSLKYIPTQQKMVIKLEDLTTKKSVLKSFLNFFDIPYEDHFLEYVKKPQNVFFPMELKMTKEEELEFFKICGKTLKRLKYPKSTKYEIQY